jgi:hypothetical protein
MERAIWKGRDVCVHIDMSKETNNGHGNILVIILAAWVKNRRETITLPLNVLPSKTANVVGHAVKKALNFMQVKPFCFVVDEGNSWNNNNHNRF